MKNCFYERGTRIVIFGSGKRAQFEYYKLRCFYNVVGFLENNNKGGSLLNKPIYKIRELKELVKNNIKIVLVDDRKANISNWMKKNGYVFLDEYIYIDVLLFDEINMRDLINLNITSSELGKIKSKMNKPFVYVFGNCQTLVIRKYLIANRMFMNDYILVVSPAIHQFNDGEEELILGRDDYLKWIDVLFIQKIKKTNKFSECFSSDNIVEMCSDNVRVYYISKLWYSGYFIQMTRPNSLSVLTNINSNGISIYGDKAIEEISKKCFDDKQDKMKVIIDRVLKGVYENNEIQQNFEKGIEDIKRCDSESDIKMLDYIKDNCMKDVLFYCPNHPKNFVIKEEVKKILELLYPMTDSFSFLDEAILDREETLKIACVPIYPEVLRYMNREDLIDTMTYQLSGLIKEELSFRKYLEYFITFSSIEL